MNVRRDGTSRFGPSRQFHNFGSIGAAWIFTKENFIDEGMAWLSYGKLRFSYGTTGNDQVGDYLFFDLYTNSNNTYQGATAVNPSNLFNPELAWEETRKTEVGLELGLLKDRILLSGSYYNNRSDNQLLSYNLPYTTGFSDISLNFPALVQNSGWEFELNTVNINKGRLSWNSSLNLSFGKNKLVDFPNLEKSSYSNFLIIGEPIDITRVSKFAGVDPASGVYQYFDKNGNLTSTPTLDDRILTINRFPDYFGGFQNSFVYKRFKLDVLFQFTKKIGTNHLTGAQAAGGQRNEFFDAYDSWKSPGNSNSFQQFTTAFSTIAGRTYLAIRTSDAYYVDASFIRLKNLAFSYTIPESLVNKIHIKNCKLYLQAQNLLTITDYKGLDPELSALGVPPLKVITAGINISL